MCSLYDIYAVILSALEDEEIIWLCLCVAFFFDTPYVCLMQHPFISFPLFFLSFAYCIVVSDRTFVTPFRDHAPLPAIFVAAFVISLIPRSKHLILPWDSVGGYSSPAIIFFISNKSFLYPRDMYLFNLTERNFT